VPRARLLLLLLLAACALTVAPAAAAADCPTTSFVRYGYLVYASVPVPTGVSLPHGAVLGTGIADDPVGPAQQEGRCGRDQADVDVVSLGDVDPLVAIGVKGRPSVAFVLGGRCSGFEGDAFWACLTEPVTFEGTSFTGVSYPAGEDRRALPLGPALGEGELGNEPVSLVQIEGVDPGIAVAIDGRPNEAYVAPGVCPYERFANSLAGDDLKRCLTGPVWLVFDPPGARVGETIVAHTDRDVAGPAEGASIQLARASVTADIVPQNSEDTDEVATLPGGPAGTEILFEVPEVEEGLYEAVVVCNGCAGSFDGRTSFPAGSIVAFSKGSQIGKIVAFVFIAIFIVLAVASVVLWRRGYAFKRRRRPA
jgi:hypothetical protein